MKRGIKERKERREKEGKRGRDKEEAERSALIFLATKAPTSGSSSSIDAKQSSKKERGLAVPASKDVTAAR